MGAHTSHAGRRVVVGSLAILGAWWLLQNVVDSMAIWRFLADGVVPGTNTSLPPDVVLASLPVVFALSAILIFRQEILRALARARTPQSKAPPAAPRVAASPAASVPTAASPALTYPLPQATIGAATVVAPKVPKVTANKPVVVIKLPRRPGVLARGLAAWSQYVAALRAYRDADRQRQAIRAAHPLPQTPRQPVLTQQLKTSAQHGRLGLNRAVERYASASMRLGWLLRRSASSSAQGIVHAPVWGWLVRQGAAALLGVAFVVSRLFRGVGWLVRLWVAAVNALLAGVQWLLVTAVVYTIAGLRIAAALSWRAVRFGWLAAILLLELFVLGVVQAAEYGLRAWRWAVPYMDACDDWILEHARRYEAYHIVSHLLREYSHGIATLYKKVRGYLRTLSRA